MGVRLIVKGASWASNAIDRITPGTTHYAVTMTLTNASVSNSASQVSAGSSYTVTVTPIAGYVLRSVTVTHNGLTVLPTGSSYTYSINSVSGAITITAVADRDYAPDPTIEYHVTYNLTHVTASVATASVAEGETYTVTLAAEEGYIINSVTVTHNGQAVTPASGHTYTIASVQGDIEITAYAEQEGASETVLATLTSADQISSGSKGYYKSADGTYVTSSTYYGMWINVQSYAGKRLKVVSGSSSTRITFVTAYESYYGSEGNFATGWGTSSDHGVYETISANTTKYYDIPANAKYVWFYIYANGYDHTPSSIQVID